jgi:hypothetical protein
VSYPKPAPLRSAPAFIGWVTTTLSLQKQFQTLREPLRLLPVSSEPLIPNTSHVESSTREIGSPYLFANVKLDELNGELLLAD